MSDLSLVCDKCQELKYACRCGGNMDREDPIQPWFISKINTLQRRVAELEKDKARLDWLTKRTFAKGLRFEDSELPAVLTTGRESSLRQAIDAAMKEDK